MKIEPLTKNAFAPFGDVVDIDGTDPREINQGFAQRFNDLADIDVCDGQTNISIFTATPRPHPIAIKLMERHPLGTQLFYPLQNEDWYVLVCENPTDEKTFRAFKAGGQQGVNYHRNTWHHPLLVTNESRFIVIDRKGAGHNLEEKWLEKELHLSFSVPRERDGVAGT
jgi:ureidoglycolate lyase